MSDITMSITFKRYLKENTNQFFTEHDRIVNWLDDQNIKNYAIDGRSKMVDVDGDVMLQGRQLQSIPVRFDHVMGDFRCGNNHLQSLKGVPNSVWGTFNAVDNPQLSSYEFLPTFVLGGLYVGKDSVVSLEGLKFEHLRWSSLALDWNKVRSHCIGLIHVDGLKSISSSCDFYGRASENPFTILNKYLGRPNDIFECQAELIENGFDDFALL